MNDVFDGASIVMNNIEFDSVIERLKQELVCRIKLKKARIEPLKKQVESLEEEVRADKEVLGRLLEITSLRRGVENEKKG